MLVAMFEWKRLEENSDNLFKHSLDGNWSDGNIKNISRNVNGSGLLNESNGEEDRIEKSQKAYENL
jgi:hypothetical protein